MEKRPELITKEYLKDLVSDITSTWWMSTIKYYTIELDTSILNDALLLLINHSGYDFLSDFLKPNPEPDNLFYFSAHLGLENIFKIYFFNEEIPDFAKKEAIKLLRKNKHENIIGNIAKELSIPLYDECRVIFFLQDTLQKDILSYIVKMLIKTRYRECLVSLLEENELPTSYKNKKINLPILFQEKLHPNKCEANENLVINIQPSKK